MAREIPTCDCIGAFPPEEVQRLIFCLALSSNALLETIAGGSAPASEVNVLTQVGAANGANSNITTGATLIAGTSTLAARATRRAVSIVNLSTSPETLYYGFTTGVTAANGVKLLAGQSQSLNYRGALFFFGAAGTATGQTVEEYD